MDSFSLLFFLLQVSIVPRALCARRGKLRQGVVYSRPRSCENDYYRQLTTSIRLPAFERNSHCVVVCRRRGPRAAASPAVPRRSCRSRTRRGLWGTWCTATHRTQIPPRQFSTSWLIIIVKLSTSSPSTTTKSSIEDSLPKMQEICA